MILTLLDVVTKKKRALSIKEEDAYYWQETTYACDCLRQKYFDVYKDTSVCIGCERFIVIDFGWEDMILNFKLWNEFYPPELISKVMLEGYTSES